MDVVLGKVELVEVGAHGCGREALLAQLRDRRVPVPLRELLPVLAEHEPVVDHLRQLAADRAGDPAMELEVRPVVGAADDVRDPELEVVDDRRELVGRRPVRPGEGRGPEAHGALVVALRSARLERPLRRRGVQRPALALPHRPLVERDAEPLEVLEDRLLPARDRSRSVGVVDPEHEHAAALVCEPPVRDRRQRVPDVQRPGRARREADADAHASIVT